MRMLLGCLCLGLITLPAHAGTITVDIYDVLRNLREIIQPMMRVVMVFSYTAGVLMIFRSLGMMRKFGMHITQASTHAELSGPMVYMVVGAMLIYLPSTTNVALLTIFGEGSEFTADGDLTALGDSGATLLNYIPSTSIEDKWADLATTLVLYIQFIGYIAFVRGLFIIARSGQPGVQPGSISKGIIHLIGGIIAVNFVTTVQIVRTTVLGL